jgi:UDP-glucose 4,6-dehydratase
MELEGVVKEMKIVIFGSNGYIGSEFVRQLKAINNIDVQSFSSRGFDGNGYTYKQLEFLLSRVGANAVINSSGYTGRPNVDACEDHKAEAMMSNVIFVKMLAEACVENQIPIAHVSSGCIYNGYEKEFTEEDSPNFCFEKQPCSFYSGTKAMAESVLETVKHKWIWRLRIPFDEFSNPRNYLTKVVKYDTLLNMRNSLSHKGDYVKACLEILLKWKPYGIYNVTNPGSVTTDEVVEILKKTLPLDREFKYFKDLEEFNGTVKTPRSNCVLSSDKLARTGIVIRPVKEALQDAISHWRE